MNDAAPKPVSERILDLIRQNEGQLGWHELLATLGPSAFFGGDVFVELRALERAGAIRHETADDGRVRYWIARPNG
jgi:hypothetical protein